MATMKTKLSLPKNGSIVDFKRLPLLVQQELKEYFMLSLPCWGDLLHLMIDVRKSGPSPEEPDFTSSVWDTLKQMTEAKLPFSITYAISTLNLNDIRVSSTKLISKLLTPLE